MVALAAWNQTGASLNVGLAATFRPEFSPKNPPNDEISRISRCSSRDFCRLREEFARAWSWSEQKASEQKARNQGVPHVKTQIVSEIYVQGRIHWVLPGQHGARELGIQQDRFLISERKSRVEIFICREATSTLVEVEQILQALVPRDRKPAFLEAVGD